MNCTTDHSAMQANEKEGYALLKQAKWIWPEGYMYLYNHFAQFRHDFNLPRSLQKFPAVAMLYITADKEYRLYVNGQHVCRGPARGYQSHWPYDSVDIRPYLRPGHNWLAVEAYTPGISTFQYLHQTKAGLLCAAEWNGHQILSGEHWQMRRSPAHRIHTARLSMQMDFQEHVSAAADDRSWIFSAIPPIGWNKEFFDHGQNITSFPFGQPPYDDVEPRGIPLLREDIHIPATVTAHGVGRNAPGYRDCENVSWFWMKEEFFSIKKWNRCEEVTSEKTKDFFTISLTPLPAAKFRAITVDLGALMVGALEIELLGATGKEILDFHYHQTLTDGRPAYLRPGEACHVALASRLRPAAGRMAHQFFHVMGIRHITIVVRNCTAVMSLRLLWRTAWYPFSMQGSFHCSDRTLNEIHAACRHTQQICALDAYVDTPWREQVQWWGDARVQARNTFFLDGDPRLFARGIRSLAGQRAPQGLTYGHAPTCSGWCILPDFSLTWIMTIWDYYWQTADISLFIEHRQRIEEIFAYFTTTEATTEEGLLRTDDRFWLFEDWADLPKDHVPTFLNLWHLYALEHYARLLLISGCHAEHQACMQTIQARRTLLVSKLYDRNRKHFISGLNKSGMPAGEPSVHDQVLASMLNLVAEAKDSMLEQLLLPCIRDQKLPGATPSAFWATNLFDCLRESGYGDEVITFILRHWTPMLATGTTWARYEWTGSESCSHAWTAHPCTHFVNILAGLNQTGPGWESVCWQPTVPAHLNYVEGVIPTPHGSLNARWERLQDIIKLRLELPRGISASIMLPGIQQTGQAGKSYCFEIPASAFASQRNT